MACYDTGCHVMDPGPVFPRARSLTAFSELSAMSEGLKRKVAIPDGEDEQRRQLLILRITSKQ
jgi:hypothetical protein